VVPGHGTPGQVHGHPVGGQRAGWLCAGRRHGPSGVRCAAALHPWAGCVCALVPTHHRPMHPCTPHAFPPCPPLPASPSLPPPSFVVVPASRAAPVGAGRRVDARTGDPLVRTGADVEVAYPSDSFKARTTSVQELPLTRKQRTDFYEKPNKASGRGRGRGCGCGWKGGWVGGLGWRLACIHQPCPFPSPSPVTPNADGASTLGGQQRQAKEDVHAV
jgi:hypothetical protein